MSIFTGTEDWSAIAQTIAAVCVMVLFVGSVIYWIADKYDK